MPDLRKLAAVDIAFLGYKFVLAEYSCAVVLPIGLGMLTLLKGHLLWQAVVGMYLICLGIDYIPMLIFSVSIGNREQARAELGDELSQPRVAIAKYRKLSLLLLVPFVVPVLAFNRK